MYSSIVEISTVLGQEYLVTTTFKDGIVIKCQHELISDINKLSQQNFFTFLKQLAEQKLNQLNKI